MDIEREEDWKKKDSVPLGDLEIGSTFTLQNPEMVEEPDIFVKTGGYISRTKECPSFNLSRNISYMIKGEYEVFPVVCKLSWKVKSVE